MVSRLSICTVLICVVSMDACGQQAERIDALKKLRAVVFVKTGHVVEVNANRTKIVDDDLRLVAGFSEMTDLSLEQTKIGSASLVHLRRLKKLEWLNLYRTQVGDEGLRHLSALPKLRHLPIGETNITDAGLAHLATMKQLLYLGLRGNKITDAGLVHLRQLTNLRGLFLGETKSHQSRSYACATTSRNSISSGFPTQPCPTPESQAL